MYSCLTVILISTSYCHCYVAYEMFRGFHTTDTYSSATIPSTTMQVRTTTHKANFTSSTTATPLAIDRLEILNSKCNDEENPVNLGPYEIPTRQDVAKLVKHKLARLFNSYHDKALNLLKDIKEATKATKDIEKKCYGPSKFSYRQCVKGVERKYELVTKSLVISLETQRHDISSVIENVVCNINEAEADPLNFIKLLAVEEVSLDFALPGFLRLLSACTKLCIKSIPKSSYDKPSRHMTDQDLVVKHFLTKKNYLQLIKNE